MGSFDYTCAISRLPIGAGDAVRFLMLQSSPFNSHRSYASGELSWYLRALPIRAKYDDYGGVEDCDPRDSVIQQNWLDGLNVDLIEKGWGDNTYCDVPTRRGMSFDDLCSALQAGRLQVRSDLETAADLRRIRTAIKSLAPSRKLSPGIPTLRRVEAAIRKAGTTTYTVDPDHVVRGPGGPYAYVPPAEQKGYLASPHPHAGFGGERVDGPRSTDAWRIDLTQLANAPHAFIVDKLRRGEVRVRVGGSPSPIEAGLRLTALAKKLRRRYSTMLSPDAYGCAELIVHPKPGTMDGDHYFGFRDRASRPSTPRVSHVAQAMVREDVWQVLCGMTCEHLGKNHKTVNGTLEVYRRFAGEAWSAYREKYARNVDVDAPFRDSLHSYGWRQWGNDAHNPVGYFTSDNPGVGGFGVDTSWKLFADQEERSDVDVETFLDVLAQTTLVDRVLSVLRVDWRPVGAVGPQCGEWKEHRKLLRNLLRVTNDRIRERKSWDD